MNRDPITRHRSRWVPLAARPIPGGELFERRVHDGTLRAIVADEPVIGWHLSISHTGPTGRARRYPTWDEIADARDALLPADIGFVMHLPASSEYVAVHPTTFHLHQHPEPGQEQS